uniref:G protein-coupled receptor n=1 Tax=Steinernema glaseri TaxID=37863 RepID=A0A1I7ZU22_9BILA
MNSSGTPHLPWESLPLGLSFITATSIFLPLYLTVIWILATDKDYNGLILYHILQHLCVANVLSLISTFMSGVFELSRTRVHAVVDICSGSLSAWFRVGHTLLNLLLSANQLSIAFRFIIPYEYDAHKYVIFLLWYALIVLILMTVYLKVDFHYDFSTHYFHDPTDQYEPVVTVVRHMTTAMCLAIACKLLFLVSPADQGCFYQINQRIHSQPVILILLQAPIT